MGKTIAQMRQERAARRAIIAAEGLRYADQVIARFGVSDPTARADLRAVYGTLPARRACQMEHVKARRSAIAARGLRTIPEIMAAFSVSRATARLDLRAVYGERMTHVLGGPAVHTNFYMLESQRARVEAQARRRGCSVSDILRLAVDNYLRQQNGVQP